MGTIHSGPKSPSWKGGRTLASSGYWLVKRPDHPLADVRGYVYEHRLIACEKLGRILERGEVVHHVNSDKLDNRPENIEVLPSVSKHRAKHGLNPNTRKQGEPNPVIACACGCGQKFKRFDSSRRPRRYVTGHNAPPRNSAGRFGPE